MKRTFGICSALICLGYGLMSCGASNTEKDFLCEAQQGVPCATIAQADGQTAPAATPIAEALEDSLGKTLSQEPLLTGKAGVAAMGDGGFPYQPQSYRVREQVGTLWIAPYLDESGLLHEARFVHFVIRPGQWQGS